MGRDPEADLIGGVLGSAPSLGHVTRTLPDQVRTLSVPRGIGRGVIVALCADEADDDVLRALHARAREVPLVAIGLARPADWCALAIARGAHACLIWDRSPLQEDALLGVIEQGFAIAQRVRGHERITNELQASVNDLSRRIDHLSAELARLEVMAWTDSLTGLANRRQLEHRLPQAYAEGVRYDRDVACLMIDLDGFKAVNDEYGHSAGDELLRLAARVIVEQTRASDICSRYGGDEFVVLMPETNASMAGAVASRLMDAFCHAAKHRLRTLEEEREACLAHCSMSIGVSCLRTSAPPSPDELLAHADSALYAAKRAGKRAVMIKTAGGGSVGLTG